MDKEVVVEGGDIEEDGFIVEKDLAKRERFWLKSCHLG